MRTKYIPPLILPLLRAKRNEPDNHMTLSVDQIMEVLKKHSKYDAELPEDSLRRRAERFLHRLVEFDH